MNFKCSARDNFAAFHDVYSADDTFCATLISPLDSSSGLNSFFATSPYSGEHSVPPCAHV